MSRFGQCPACRKIHQIDVDDIGSVVHCQCGSTLFAADIVGFNEIPVFCSNCSGEYVVDRDGAGENVQCDCGQLLTVPNIVLRSRITRIGPAVAPPTNTPPANTNVTTKASTAEVQPAAKNISTSNNATADDSADDAEPDSPKRKRRAWSVNAIGMIAAVLLLCFSMSFFLYKQFAESKHEQAAAGSKEPLVPISGSDGLMKIEMKMIDIDFPRDDLASDDSRDDDSFNQPPRDESTDRASNAKGTANGIKQFPPPKKQPLPPAKPSRQIVPIPKLPHAGVTFKRAYEEAFEAFEKTRAMEKASDKKADKDEDSSAYQKQLGLTIARLRLAMDKIGPQQSQKQITELYYLLTYVYFRAGRLPEAAVMAESTIRWGNLDNEATREAGLIGLAALQEANQTHWGLGDQVGELDLMNTLIDVYADRWPDDEQIDNMRLALAGAYERFDQPLKAVDLYRNTPVDSPHYVDSQFAAGNAMWGLYRTRISELPNDADSAAYDSLVPLRDDAKALLTAGLRALGNQPKQLTPAAIVAKFNLVRIELNAGNPAAAESLLVDDPLAITKTIAAESKPGVVKVNQALLRSVYETLFTIRFERGDTLAANEALAKMSSIEGVADAQQIGKLYVNVAADYIDQLLQRPHVTRQQLSKLSELIKPLQQQDGAMSVANTLWLGEAWSRLARRAATEELANRCYEKAAAAYKMAMSRDDFPQESMQSAMIRRMELTRQSGRVDETVDVLTELLRQSPNAFGLQIEATQALQNLAAKTGQVGMLWEVIDGSPQSPIWGWNKLIAVLHSQRQTEENTATMTNRLMQCRYNLLWCRWQIARATIDPTIKQKRLDDLQRMKTRVKTTMKSDVEPWASRFDELCREIDST